MNTIQTGDLFRVKEQHRLKNTYEFVKIKSIISEPNSDKLKYNLLLYNNLYKLKKGRATSMICVGENEFADEAEYWERYNYITNQE